MKPLYLFAELLSSDLSLILGSDGF